MKLSMPTFNQAAVLVVGDLMLDQYWYGPTTRISPEAPVPVVKVDQIENRVGGAGNVALNLSALGARVGLVAVTGQDEAADTLKSSLSAAGVTCDFQSSEHNKTITKLRVMSRNQQLIRMDFEEGFTDCSEQAVAELFEQRLSDCSVVIFSDYHKGTLKNPAKLIELARAKGKKVLADPKGTDFSKYRGAYLLTPNLNEFEAVVGPCADETSLVAKGHALLKELDIEALLVTRGEHGMTLIRANESELHLPARAREVFDVTGAGDTVISVLAAAFAAGEPLAESVAIANLAAGIVVGKLGTAVVSAPELRRVIQRELGAERGVLSKQQLQVMIEDARAHGEKIVFTNGCFDIIHAGHVEYLEQAKAEGDRLVVAVNGDESIRRIKGSGRPINPVDRRMAVLAGLGSVDWVLSFTEDTPVNLLTELKPDVLVKGGDYRISEVVGGELVKEYGGVVKVLGVVDDCSTTAIVEKIKGQDAE
ncbi:MAG: bifunctional heptose 7-phosphate kinase/heptose 1-phosphate adenyltransferase [Gammaproteobacteria bacterium]|nr:MAG: bifunctional heptose 7-phosphate kinase/heptose 1-phosphate adenyltransferase [Gammaproteobacteria bacterium]